MWLSSFILECQSASTFVTIVFVETMTTIFSGWKLDVQASAGVTWKENGSVFGKGHCVGLTVSNMEFLIFYLR